MARQLPDDVSGKLTKDERDRIVARLREKGAPKACALCGQSSWRMGEYLVTPAPLGRTEKGVKAYSPDPVYPSVVLLCQNCGNSNLVNLKMLNLRDVLSLPEQAEE